MAQGRARKVIGRVVVGLVLVLAAAGTWAGYNWTHIRAKYAASRLKTAAGDEERAGWADALAARGEAGLAVLLELVREGDPQTRAAAAAALDRYLTALPDGDPKSVVLCGRLLDTFGACGESGREAVVDLLPTILKRGGIAHPAKCREVVTAGLKMPGAGSRLTAVRAAMHPALRMRADLLPLLNAPEPEVRRAALFAVGPATDDEPVIGDEDLFRWLHDPDDGVRKVGHDALVSRGRTDPEIALGRRLTHPDAHERLKLLLDLRYDDDVADPEPWLERLSRDADPGVRAGAARVVVELVAERQLAVPVWVGRLADTDADPTVRRIAQFYRSQPTRTNDIVRPAAGP
ncbi:MAG: hypothetical protein JWO38_7991 [Gemmataceae bacterium]|nr:hypothetical protein [Gemmataceae bacterium]